MFLLRTYLPEAYDPNTYVAAGKMIVASLLMGVAIWFWMQFASDMSFYLSTAGGIVIGALVYGGLALLLRLEEIKEVPRILLRR